MDIWNGFLFQVRNKRKGPIPSILRLYNSTAKCWDSEPPERFYTRTIFTQLSHPADSCLLYTSDAADE